MKEKDGLNFQNKESGFHVALFFFNVYWENAFNCAKNQSFQLYKSMENYHVLISTNLIYVKPCKVHFLNYEADLIY